MVSLSDAAAKICKERQSRSNLEDDITKEGWAILDFKKHTIALSPVVKNFPPNAQLCFMRDSTPSSSFRSFLTDDLIMQVLNRNKDARSGYGTVSDGKGYLIQRIINLQTILQYLACRVLIQGYQYKHTGGSKETFAEMKNYLAAKCNAGGKMCGVSKLVICHSLFFISEQDEIDKLFENILKSVLVPGQVSCADEKLFRFTGKHAFVRKVPNKPAKVGLWFYQTVLMLEGELPYLVYSRLHDSDKTIQKTVKTTEIIQDWMTLSHKFKNQTIVVMDSYYMTKDGATVVEKNAGHVIAALQPNRFSKIFKFMDENVKQAGDLCILYKETTKETMVLYHNKKSEIGKKLVYSNCHTKIDNQKPPKHHVPVYDHYGQAFGHCDKFNKAIASKNFPFRVGGGRRTGPEASIMDYIVVSLLMTSYHAYLYTQKKKPKEYPFRSFTEDLAVELVEDTM